MAVNDLMSQIVRRLSAMEQALAAVREPTNSCCIVEIKSAQTIAHDTETIILYETEIRDLDDLHSTTLNTGRITVKVPGVYLVTVGCRAAAQAGGTMAVIRIRLNGTTIRPAHHHPAQNYPSQIGTTVVVVATVAGDYFDSTFYQNSGGDLNIDLGRFAAVRIA